MSPRSDKEELEERLNAAGTRLLRPPSSIGELLSLLDRTEDLLSKVEQSPGKVMHTALTPLMKALVAEDLLKHSHVDVKVGVASCISEITRITAPDAPYDDVKMKDVFQLIVASFENMSDTSSRSYGKRATVLEIVARSKSCVLMWDLECDQMIVEMFQHFLKGIRDHHAELIFASMETIMTLVIEESEDISPELLNPILATLERNNEAAVLPIAKKLAEKVIQSCADKLRPYLIEALKTSVDDYSEVVASVCRENTGTGGLSNENIPKEEPVFEGENISEAKKQKQKQRSGRKRRGVSTNKDKALTEEGASKNDGGSSRDSLDQTQKLVDASNKPAKNGPPSNKETRKKSGRVNKDKIISIEEVALKNDTRSQGQTEKVQVDSLNKADAGSLSRKEDMKKSGRVKPKPAKDVLKSSAREDDDKEIGTEQEKVTSPSFPVKSTKDGSNKEETPRINTKGKQTPATKKASEIKYGKNLVGSKVKVWWPDDQEFYEGVIASFDSGKKHKVLYNDGEIEVLNLRNEEWEFVGDDPDHSDGDQDNERKKKNKATPSSEASSKRAKMEKNSSEEVTVETREVSPSHFLFKIESFSLLSQNGIDKYESTEFSAGDYKWKLIFYPKGEESENDDDDNIAVNLAVADTSSLPPRWEVNAVFSIFLYNQKSNKFLAMRGPTRRFHAVKTEWGFPKFISKKSLIDPSNGYLVKDNCVFGAEVFVVKSHGVVECLSMSGDEKPFHRSWKISQFSKLEKKWVSEKFIVGDHTWKMEIYPRGDGDQKGRSISIFLHLVDCSLTPFHKVKANFTLKIKDQNNGEDWIEIGNDWFASRYDYWGFPDFMSISDMNDPAKGYLVEDCCILEVEISVQAVAHSLIP